MSEENTPKLRLKPKLSADTPAAQAPAPAPAAPPPEAAPATQPAAEAPKLVRLKPKLGPAPEPAAAASPAEPAPAPAEVAQAPAAELPPAVGPAPAPAAEPAPAAKPAFKLGLKPRMATPAPAGEAAPPPAAEGEAPPVLNAPPPPPMPVETDRGENGEPAEITAMRKATSAPFPPPGKFPPPPGLKKALAEASQEVAKGAPAKSGSKKKLMLLGGVAALLVLGGGGFFGYLKLTEEPPPPPPKPKLSTNPTTVQGKAVAAAQNAVAQANEQTAAVNEVMDDGQKPAAVAATPAAEPVPVPVEEIKPVAPPPPPPPSVAFRGWVENLKISGMRGGATPRIFVGGSSYKAGDLVNPQLSITFEGYDEATRMLTFKDKTGATVQRRY